MKKKRLLIEQIDWDPVDEPEFPFSARHDGLQMQIRINSFPSDHLYTLMAGKSEVVGFDDWPEAWTRKPKAAKFKVAGSSAGTVSKSYSRSAAPKRNVSAGRATSRSQRTFKAAARKSK